MKGLQHLLSCGRVLGVLLFLSVCVSIDAAGVENATASDSVSHLTSAGRSVSEATGQMDATTDSQVYSSDHTSSLPDPMTTSLPSTTRTSPEATTTTTTTSTTTATTASDGMLSNKVCATALVVTGGVILVCFILLTSTLLLALKVCQLNRRIKTLSNNGDLVSNSEYWMGTARRDKSKSETEAKETTVLMADLQQTQEEKKNGAVKEDGEKVNEDGQKEEGKKAGDADPSEEASAARVTEAENSSSKPQKEAADSKSPGAEEASPSEAAEPAKDGK